MKKALAAILAVLAHLSPIAADFAIDAARDYTVQTHNIFPQIYAMSGCAVVFGLLYCGALVLLMTGRMPSVVPAIGFFASFFYTALFAFGYFYGWFARYETLFFAAMFIPFWFVLLVRSAWAHKKALLEPGRPE